jgi:hypothetical protein
MKSSEDQTMFANGFDEAIIGLDTSDEIFRVVYDIDKIIEISTKDGETTEEDALEYFYNNIQGSYVGAGTPIYIHAGGHERVLELMSNLTESNVIEEEESIHVADWIIDNRKYILTSYPIEPEPAPPVDEYISLYEYTNKPNSVSKLGIDVSNAARSQGIVLKHKTVENSKYNDGVILLYPRSFLEKYFQETPIIELAPKNTEDYDLPF